MSNKQKPPPPTAEEIAAVMAIFREKERKRQEFADQYGDMRPPQVVQVGDDVYTAIEGGLYHAKRVGSATFMNVLHDHALMVFGVPYLEAEEKLKIEERHPALQWMYAFVEHHNSLEKDRQAKDQVGFAAAWFRFAYDLFTIRDNAKFESKMKERLLSKRYFQGARHELRVAALSIAAGFSIEFEDEQDNKIGHAEFVGTDRAGMKISVEAKSRHRYGIQGFMGGKRLEPGSSADLRGIILDAYKKKTALPLYAFVDANLPSPTSKEHLHDWWREIHDTMSDLEKEGYGEACPANALFICNDPSHYIGGKQIISEHDNLWILHFESKDPRVPHPAPDMPARFKKAYTQRIAPPDNIPDFT